MLVGWAAGAIMADATGTGCNLLATLFASNWIARNLLNVDSSDH